MGQQSSHHANASLTIAEIERQILEDTGEVKERRREGR